MAVGLLLTWVSGQRVDFRDYLLQREEAEFSFRGVDYRVRFAGLARGPRSGPRVFINEDVCAADEYMAEVMDYEHGSIRHK